MARQMIQTGCNDVGNKQITENKIAKWIMKVERKQRLFHH